MKGFQVGGAIVLAAVCLVAAPAVPAAERLPVVRGKQVVAMVEREPITLDEFKRELAALQRGKGKDATVTETERADLLTRMINTKLLTQEARRIGLDELAEIKNMVDVFSRITLREELMLRYTQNVRVDDKEVDRVYKDAVKEWRLTSVLFDREEDARKMQEAVVAGKDFTELARQLLAEKTAKAIEESKDLRAKEVDPKIADVVAKLSVGAVSPVVPFRSGYVLLRLEGVRYPESSDALVQAKRDALKKKTVQVLTGKKDALLKKYVKVRTDTLNAIDYQSPEPGFETLRKDRRVLAEIQGEAPITVGELTEAIRQQLYHGVERAIEGKRLNAKKASTLDELVYKRVFRKEALRLGLDKTARYRDKVKAYEESVVFGAFVQKAVVPDVKVREEDVKTYYQQHAKEYELPEMVRMQALVFGRRSDAEMALEKLRKGAEFQWLLAHAEGQVDPAAEGVKVFDGKPLTTKDLPPGLQRAISGVKAGDFQLYESPEGYVYLLSIQGVVASRPQPYEDVRETVLRRLYDEKVKQAIEEYAQKVRAASDVKVYLKG